MASAEEAPRVLHADAPHPELHRAEGHETALAVTDQEHPRRELIENAIDDLQRFVVGDRLANALVVHLMVWDERRELGPETTLDVDEMARRRGCLQPGERSFWDCRTLRGESLEESGLGHPDRDALCDRRVVEIEDLPDHVGSVLVAPRRDRQVIEDLLDRMLELDRPGDVDLFELAPRALFEILRRHDAQVGSVGDPADVLLALEVVGEAPAAGRGTECPRDELDEIVLRQDRRASRRGVARVLLAVLPDPRDRGEGAMEGVSTGGCGHRELPVWRSRCYVIAHKSSGCRGREMGGLPPSDHVAVPCGAHRECAPSPLVHRSESAQESGATCASDPTDSMPPGGNGSRVTLRFAPQSRWFCRAASTTSGPERR
jgi:hypothetical protein